MQILTHVFEELDLDKLDPKNYNDYILKAVDHNYVKIGNRINENCPSLKRLRS